MLIDGHFRQNIFLFYYFIGYFESIINKISFRVCEIYLNTISPSLHLVSFIIAFAEWIKISQGATTEAAETQSSMLECNYWDLLILNFTKLHFKRILYWILNMFFCWVLWTLISSWLSQRLLNNYPANYFNLNKIGNLKWHQLNQREFEISSPSRQIPWQE